MSTLEIQNVMMSVYVTLRDLDDEEFENVIRVFEDGSYTVLILSDNERKSFNTADVVSIDVKKAVSNNMSSMTSLS